MQDYFTLSLAPDELRNISSLGLAHMGDAVYEILVRGFLCSGGRSVAKNLHRDTVSMVCAPAQAKAAEKLQPLLTEEELAVFRRGRNAHVKLVPRSATRGEYMQATGLEALFGWLYLNGCRDRLNELFSAIMEGEQDAS